MKLMNRRDALKLTAATATTMALGWSHAVAAQTTAPSGPFTLPPLPYAFDALEPYIDAQTMQIHHDKHHAAYVANLNKAVAGTSLADMKLEDILRDLNAVPENIRTAVRNHGGGHANHTLFWQILGKDAPPQPKGALLSAIERKFGSFDAFKAQFSKAATGVFGSGWAWLSLDAEKQLRIETTPNQDTPLSSGRTPLLTIDVWEHAYYLKYQNRRPEYIEAFFKVVQWESVMESYERVAG